MLTFLYVQMYNFIFTQLIFLGEISLTYPKVWANAKKVQNISKLTNFIPKPNLV